MAFTSDPSRLWRSPRRFRSASSISLVSDSPTVRRWSRLSRAGWSRRIVDESRFQQGYFAVQKAYEAAAKRGGPAPPGIRIPCSVVLASNLREAGAGQSLNDAFERVIFQRTADIIAHQRMLQEANTKLENLANTDPLTGLFNRRRIQEALQYEVDRARRYGMVSLMMIDLNWFKLLNDQYGHNAGTKPSRRSPSFSNPAAGLRISARLGGDEFAVILPQTGADGSAIVRQGRTSDLRESRDSPVPATLPEVLVTSAELGAAQGDDGVCATNGPVHASPLKPGTDRHFAAGLEDAGGGTETLGAKFRVTHASAIVEDVQRAFGGLGAGSEMGTESVDDGMQFALIEFRAARRCPWFAFAGYAEDRLSGSVQSFFGVVPIENLCSLGEQFPGGVPNPSRAIAQHHAMGSLREASPRCFAQYALGEVRPIGAGIRSTGAFNRGRIRD